MAKRKSSEVVVTNLDFGMLALRIGMASRHLVKRAAREEWAEANEALVEIEECAERFRYLFEQSV